MREASYQSNLVSSSPIPSLAKSLFQVWINFALGSSDREKACLTALPKAQATLKENGFVIAGVNDDSTIERTLTLYGINNNKYPLEPNVVAHLEPNNTKAPSSPAIDNSIKATRLFSTDELYPPKSFAAYGIVAFPFILASQADRVRGQEVCRAFTNVLQPAMNSAAPVDQQMVTVWPVSGDEVANELNSQQQLVSCDKAVTHYRFTTARRALKAARRGKWRDSQGPRMFRDRGPYLFAWSPSAEMGAQDALVLAVDLSRVEGLENFRRLFAWWESEIQLNPDIWHDGFNMTLFKAKVDTFVANSVVDIASKIEFWNIGEGDD